MAAALLDKVLPFDLFETRRLLGAAVGLIGLAITWRIGRRIGGPLAGLIALVLLATCPLYYGHMFINPKDAPFAVAMALFLLGLVRAARAISEALARPRSSSSASASACRSARASWRASACVEASVALGAAVRDRSAHRGLRAADRRARPSSAGAAAGGRPRLCGDGAGLALGRDQSAQSDPCHRDLLALLRKALAGAVRRPTDRAARHAAELCADVARRSSCRRCSRCSAVAGVLARSSPRVRQRATPRRRAMLFALALAAVLPIAVTVIDAPGDVQRRPAFRVRAAAARGRRRPCRRVDRDWMQRGTLSAAWRWPRSPSSSPPAWRCR